MAFPGAQRQAQPTGFSPASRPKAAAKPSSPNNIVSNSIDQARNANFFNPMGSDQLRGALRRRALRTAKNRRRSGSTLGRLAGLGAQGQRQAFVDVDRQATGQRADFLNRSAENEMFSNRDFSRGLLNRERGFQFQSDEAQKDRDFQQELARKRQLGQIASDVGGVAGSFLPIPGKD